VHSSDLVLQGNNCEYCKPLYVGDAGDGGQCISCFDFCNRHAPVCMLQFEYEQTITFPGMPTDPNGVSSCILPLSTRVLVTRDSETRHCLCFQASMWLTRGPQKQEDAVCINCQNNTEGRQCSTCKNGYFRLDSMPAHHACIP